MKVSKEYTPYEFLENESWECETLLERIDMANMEEEFNDYVEEQFDGQCPTETELNDFLRFNEDEICEALGIDDEEAEDDDEEVLEEEDIEELDKAMDKIAWANGSAFKGGV